MASGMLSFSQTDSGVALREGTFPLAIAPYGAGILRVRIGEADPSSRHTYINDREHRDGGDAAQARAFGIEGTGEAAAGVGFRVRLDRAMREADFRLSDDRSAWRLLLDRVETGPRRRLCLKLAGEQHLYGLGHGGQGFDRLGATIRLWNTHINHGPGSHFAIPLIVSTAGFGLFFDEASAGTIHPGDLPDEVWVEFAGSGALDLYCIGGGDLRGVLAGVADLLGHAQMPPRWALGFMQSSRHFTGPDEVAGLARTLRDNALPTDALIFLSTYGEGKGWNRAVGRLEFEPATFPDPDAALAAFAAEKLRVITHEYPVLHSQSPLFAEAAARGYLLDDGYPDIPPAVRQPVGFHEGQRYLDFARGEVRDWWWGAHRDLIRRGVAGWWLDGGEGPLPETESPTGAAGLHNRFDLLRMQAFAEGEARDRPDIRP